MGVVAPHAGAWIETTIEYGAKTRGWVAPHAGAWIETVSSETKLVKSVSLPMWGRGLKHEKIKMMHS